MVLDDPGGETLTLGVQVDSGREWTGDQWRLIQQSRVCYCAAHMSWILKVKLWGYGDTCGTHSLSKGRLLLSFDG